MTLITGRPAPTQVLPEQRQSLTRPRPPSQTPYADQFSGFFGAFSPALNDLKELRKRQKEREKIRQQNQAQAYLATEKRIQAGVPESVIRPIIQAVRQDPFTVDRAEERRAASSLQLKMDPNMAGTTVDATHRRTALKLRDGIRDKTIIELPGIGNLLDADWDTDEPNEILATMFLGEAEMFGEVPPILREDLEQFGTGLFLEAKALIGERKLAKEAQVRLNTNRVSGASMVSALFAGEPVEPLLNNWAETTAPLTRKERDEVSKLTYDDFVAVARNYAENSGNSAFETVESMRYFQLQNGETIESAAGGPTGFDGLLDYISDVPDKRLDDHIQINIQKFQQWLKDKGIDINNPMAVEKAADEFAKIALGEYSPHEAEAIREAIPGDTDKQIIGNLRYAIESESISVQEAFERIQYLLSLGYIDETEAAGLAGQNGARMRSARDVSMLAKVFGGLQSNLAQRAMWNLLNAETDTIATGEAPSLNSAKMIGAQIQVMENLEGDSAQFMQLLKPQLGRVKAAGLEAANKKLGQRYNGKMEAWDAYKSQIEEFDELPLGIQKEFFTDWNNHPEGGRAHDDLADEAREAVDDWTSIGVEVKP